MNLVSRREWGARPARERPLYLARTRGVKVHYTGANEDRRMLADHDRCAARVRSIQNGHMDGNGWDDLGYSGLVCPHGYVFAGRGPHALPAANGPGLNSGHYAVCALIGNKGITTPTPRMLEGIRDAIDWLRRDGAAGDQIRGHRDGYPTDCPGDVLYAWVRRGAPRPDDEGDDVPEYVSVIAGRDEPIPPGAWHTIVWRREASDRGRQHPDGGGPGLLTGPARYSLTASVILEGLAVGAELQIRAVETGKPDDLGPIAEFAGTSGKTFALYNLAMDSVTEGHTVTMQAQHWQDPAAGAVTLRAGSVAKLGFWR